MNGVEILELRIKTQMEKLGAIPENTCWVDGEKCPYGLPGGRFDQRPEQFCFVPFANKSGCNKLRPLADVIEGMAGEIRLEAKTTEIEDSIEKEKVTLDSEVRVVADDGEFTDDEKKIVNLAADLIQRHELNTGNAYAGRSYIVRVNNL